MTGDATNYSQSCEQSRLSMKLAIFAAILAFGMGLFSLLAGVIYEWAGIGAFSLGVIPYALACLFSLSAMFHGMLSANAADEEMEKILLQKRKESQTSLLDVAEDVRFTAGRTLKNYTKYAPSVLSLLGFILAGVLLYLGWRKAASFGIAGIPLPKQPMNLAFVCVLMTAVSLFAGVFLAGQSRVREFRWLRPVGAWLTAGAGVNFLAGVPAILLYYKVGGWEMPIAKLVFVVLVILAIELVLTFITEFYRPRTQMEDRPIYESRLLGLFIEPGSVAKNIANTLDYQFGFNISGTSLYSILCRVAIPIVLVWLAVLWLFTGIAEVGPGELGIKTRFGAVLPGKPLTPGVYLKLPWPCERIVRVSVDKTFQVEIGISDQKKEEESKEKKDNRTVLWTTQHTTGEFPFLVANDSSSSEIQSAVSLLNATLPVVYQVRPEFIREYAFRFNDVQKYLKDLGTREATIYFSSTDFIKDMSTARLEVSRKLQERIQKAVDKAGLGIRINCVNLLDTHPPVEEVAPAFQDVFCAQEAMGAEIEKANAYRITTNAQAAIKVLELVRNARAYKYNVTKVSAADADRFESQLKAYRVMPEMFRLRTYLSFLETDCAPLRKYIVSATIPYQIMELNAEEKPRLDLLDTNLNDLK